MTRTLTAPNIHWNILPEFRRRLPDGIQLDDWMRTGQASIVKHGPHRTVYRVCLGDLEFYLKHNRLPDARTWLRQLIRASKARLEFDKARAVAERGVPTITPIGLGETPGPGPGDSFLLTLSLRTTEPLSQFLEAPIDSSFRRAVARALGRFLARMHDAGIVHNDLHAGNFLIRRTEDNRPELFLIDVHAVHLGERLAWQEAKDNLVILNRWFAMRATRSDRSRFWRAYCEHRADSARERRSLGETERRREEDDRALDMERATLASNLEFWRDRDRRCLVNNRYYQHVSGDGVTGHAVRDLDGSLLENLLGNPDEPFTAPDVVLLKDSPSSTVVEFQVDIDGQSRPVIYKRFRVNSWDDPLRSLVRRSSALRSWLFGQGLRERGLPTARPLAVFHRRRAGLLYEGYLLTEKIPDAVDLRSFVGTMCLPAETRRLIERVARLIRTLHQRNLSHRDLKAANILMSPARCPWSLVVPHPAEEEHEAWLIDLVGVSLHDKLSRRRRMQDLARLHVSFHQSPHITRTDKLRFLRVYLQWGISGRMGWKRWWRGIEALTAAKIERNRRNGRPLA